MTGSGVLAGPVRIGNCSGFYGDRLSAMHEMLAGGQLDHLTGDYLAELTMLILGKDTMRDPTLGYARTFVKQCEESLGLALEQGVKIISNAGGLNPAGLMQKLREVARGLGLDPAIAYVTGDDLLPEAQQLGLGNALTANAYLGGFGIAAALRHGADVVVTGRVTDASVVLGPAVAHHGWTSTDLDALAGAVVAGHVIECGSQACGGNFAGFTRLSREARSRPLGFPIAEIAADGSSVITKHSGTGGAVTLDTVTAQLVYEIQSTRYLNPDVTADLGSVELRQDGPDRVALFGVRGQAPPATLKVCVNELGGWRNSMEFLLTEPDLDAKEDWVRRQVTQAWGSAAPATVVWARGPRPVPNPATMAEAATSLRVTALDPDQLRAGKGFTAPAVEIALGSYPGLTLTAPPAAPTPYGIYRPEYVARSAVTHTVVHADGRHETVPDPSVFGPSDVCEVGRSTGSGARVVRDPVTVPLGDLVWARSGDKGGNANLGLWIPRDEVTDAEKYAARVAWLTDLVTPERIRELLPETTDLPIDVYALPHLGGVNVVIRGLLGAGVAASTRTDPQAKALGEWIRSRHVEISRSLL